MKRIALAVLVAASAACGSSSMTSGPTVATANVQDYQFVPPTLTIKAGTEVRWNNIGTVAHTVTSDSSALFGSGQMAAPGGGGGYGGPNTNGGFYIHTFATPGTFTYHCTNHPQMTGTVTVTP